MLTHLHSLGTQCWTQKGFSELGSDALRNTSDGTLPCARHTAFASTKGIIFSKDAFTPSCAIDPQLSSWKLELSRVARGVGGRSF